MPLNELKYEKLVEGRLDYKSNPELLDIAQDTRNEKLMFEKSIEIAQSLFPPEKPVSVLDLCCGSAMFTKNIIESINVSSVYCVDNDPGFIQKSRENLIDYNNVSYYCEDATYFKSEQKIDLILMGSAYHHIEDDLKVEFLRNAKANLKEEGYIIVAENFLPEYEKGNLESYKEAVYTFYSELFKWLEGYKTDEHAINILRQTAWFGFKREYEWKVSLNFFLNTLKKTKFKIRKQTVIWSGKKSDTEYGSSITLL